ncbi:MAG: 50S ribosomal protein L11 methyltransferase [Anaerolineae bacterium]
MSKQQRWVEIGVEADRNAIDDLVGLLGRYCAGGAVVEDLPDRQPKLPAGTVIVKGFLPEWDQETLRKLEIALLLLSRNSGISEPRIRILEPEDWAESWKVYFTPQRIGVHTVIVPTWHAYEAGPDDTIIHLDPGMAFGTGLHASTRLCLVAVERLLCPGMRVLDVGTGSGILAIAAALQGASEVMAVDTDPIAVQVAQANTTLNGVEGIVRVERGTLGGDAPADVPRLAGGSYDLLLINILAEVIIDMASEVADALRPGGLLAASGIIRSKANEVAAALEAVGITVDERILEEDWAALMGHRAE